jgi:hypothetical protein
MQCLLSDVREKNRYATIHAGRKTFCVALTFDDVSTIWVYKANITRIVGRLFVSLNQVLALSTPAPPKPNVATVQVASCRDDKGYQMLVSVQLEGEYSPAFKTHFSQRIGNFDIPSS